jgi:TonB family protein
MSSHPETFDAAPSKTGEKCNRRFGTRFALLHSAMKLSHFAAAPLLALSIGLVGSSPAAAEDFEAAKALYVSASYEDALAALEKVDRSADPIQVNAYRALCLVALGRVRDAEAPLEQIVRANPLYKPAAEEVSPRLVELFNQVRARTLPDVARQLYAEAKSSFEAKNVAEANAKFKKLLVVIAETDVRATPGMADLKDLADGFLALAAAKADVEQAKAAAAAKPPAPAPPPVLRIFTSADREVTPPVDVERVLPPWTPSSQSTSLGSFKGTLRVVVDEQGRVEEATLVDSIHPTYNRELLKAAKNWRYQPARRDGVPVKYALTMEIVLHPNGQ